jgi:hypothetical protein
MTLTRRIIAEKRRLVVPLAIVLAANASISAGFVYPLWLSVEGASGRAEAAAAAVRAADQRHRQAQATVAGKARADQELQRFYREVLPADLAAARRITYLRVAQLAERQNLRYERRTVAVEAIRDSRLQRLKMTMVLAGAYGDVRRFIHQLETSSDFVVIDDVSIAQGEDRNAPLVLTLGVSTFFLAPVE